MYNTRFHESDLSEYTFLVTGGAGFIGSHIVEYLLKYNAGKVRVLDNFSTGSRTNVEALLPGGKIEMMEGDITRMGDCEAAAKGVDFVFHQAALGSVPRSIENPLATHAANVDGFMHMLIASRDAGCKRFIYASSSSVYGDHPALPKKEDATGEALSPYAVSKKLDELYAQVFHLVYEMPVIGLRYFNIFGPRQNPKGPYAAAIPLFMDALRQDRQPVIFGDGEQTRDFTFVENAVQGNIKACFTKNSEAFGDVFNIATGERTSIKETFEILKKHSGSSIEPVYAAARAGDVKDSLADISKARRILGYEPTVKFEKGLEMTFRWFRDNESVDIATAQKP